jgi:MtN3 and saliva related transmembrane protein
MNATWLGMLAGALTTFAAVPQLIKTWTTRHARDLSFWQLVILITGITLWLCYGLLVGDKPLIVANGFSLICYLVLLALKIHFDRVTNG